MIDKSYVIKVFSLRSEMHEEQTSLIKRSMKILYFSNSAEHCAPVLYEFFQVTQIRV